MSPNQQYKSVNGPSQKQRKYPSSIPRHPTKQSRPDHTKKGQKRRDGGIARPNTHQLTSSPKQVSRKPPRRTSSLEHRFQKDVLPPPLHLHHLRPLNPLPQTHNRMPARLDRTRPTPLDRLRTRHAPLPKLETREALPVMPRAAGGVDERHRSDSNDQIRRREVACFVRHAGARKGLLGSKGG
jgi:hypothetical protein